MTRARGKAEQRVIDPAKAAQEYVDSYPMAYDATMDPLAEKDDHAIAVNELLKHLRAVLPLARQRAKGKR